MKPGVRGERSSSPLSPGDLFLILPVLGSGVTHRLQPLGTQPSNFNYVLMVRGIEAGRGRLGRGGKGGIKPSWLMAPTSGASLLKLFSCTDDSKQGGGVESG